MPDGGSYIGDAAGAAGGGGACVPVLRRKQSLSARRAEERDLGQGEDKLRLSFLQRSNDATLAAISSASGEDGMIMAPLNPAQPAARYVSDILRVAMQNAMPVDPSSVPGPPPSWQVPPPDPPVSGVVSGTTPRGGRKQSLAFAEGDAGISVATVKTVASSTGGKEGYWERRASKRASIADAKDATATSEGDCEQFANVSPTRLRKASLAAQARDGNALAPRTLAAMQAAQ